jgi:quinol monooxygenase YgiN
LIGQIVVAKGRRSELAAILANLGEMPGCIGYVVANDTIREDVLWVTEVWESAEAHAAALDLPEVHAAIERGRPLIVRFESRVETQPVWGLGVGE